MWLSWVWTLPPHFPEDCIMSFFFVAGVGISSSASWRNPSLNALPWGFPQELATEANTNRPSEVSHNLITLRLLEKHTQTLLQHSSCLSRRTNCLQYLFLRATALQCILRSTWHSLGPQSKKMLCLTSLKSKCWEQIIHQKQSKQYLFFVS